MLGIYLAQDKKNVNEINKINLLAGSYFSVQFESQYATKKQLKEINEIIESYSNIADKETGGVKKVKLTNWRSVQMHIVGNMDIKYN